MEELQVVTFCTKPAGLLAQYQEQLQNAGMPLAIEPLREMPHNVGNLEFKIKNFREALEKYRAKRIVFSDAWDVLFYGTKDEVISKIPDVLCAAERNCWPDAYLAEYFKGGTPWKFFNGGLMAGTRDGLLDWLERIEKHPQYQPKLIDQQWFNFRLMECDPIAPVDEYTRLFYCMILEQGELQFKNGRPANTLLGTAPNFIHFNGKTDSTMFFLKQYLGTR